MGYHGHVLLGHGTQVNNKPGAYPSHSPSEILARAGGCDPGIA